MSYRYSNTLKMMGQTIFIANYCDGLPEVTDWNEFQLLLDLGAFA